MCAPRASVSMERVAHIGQVLYGLLQLSREVSLMSGRLVGYVAWGLAGASATLFLGAASFAGDAKSPSNAPQSETNPICSSSKRLCNGSHDRICVIPPPILVRPGTSGMCSDGTYTSAIDRSAACVGHCDVEVWWGLSVWLSSADRVRFPTGSHTRIATRSGQMRVPQD
jgi:hypothetical protein